MGQLSGERHDGDGKTVRAIRHIQAKPEANMPALLSLDAVNDSGVITQYYLWVDSNGKLRISNTIPTDQDADGTVVGTQT